MGKGTPLSQGSLVVISAPVRKCCGKWSISAKPDATRRNQRHQQTPEETSDFDGLRAEEVLALHWSDVDFDHLVIHVSRVVVHGRVKTVKTEYSEDELPLDPDFATCSGLLLNTLCPEIRAGLPQPRDGAKLPCKSDPAGLHRSCRVPPGALPDVFSWLWNLVHRPKRKKVARAA